MRDLPALRSAIAHCIKCGVQLPRELLKFVAAKTTGSFQANLWAAVQHLYQSPNGFGQMEFETYFQEIITFELTQAWQDGMRSLGLDPLYDNTEAGDAELAGIVADEISQSYNLESDIMDAALADPPIPVNTFRSRIALWVNRYNDTKNQAIAYYSGLGQRLKWKEGGTHDKCDTCVALNGLVAFASEWEQAGFHPQQPPNDLLACSGWKCECELEPTNERRSYGVMAKLLDIAAAANV
jgi:hypothetical protein